MLGDRDRPHKQLIWYEGKKRYLIDGTNMIELSNNPYPPDDPRGDAWQLGYVEADGDIGMTYDDDPNSPRSVAYDEGRTAGESDLAKRDERPS